MGQSSKKRNRRRRGIANLDARLARLQEQFGLARGRLEEANEAQLGGLESSAQAAQTIGAQRRARADGENLNALQSQLAGLASSGRAGLSLAGNVAQGAAGDLQRKLAQVDAETNAVLSGIRETKASRSQRGRTALAGLDVNQFRFETEQFFDPMFNLLAGPQPDQGGTFAGDFLGLVGTAVGGYYGGAGGAALGGAAGQGIGNQIG